MNSYLVPANAKKSTLIFSLFRPFDLILFGTGAIVTLLLLVVIQSSDTVMILISCLPVAVTGFLVVPIPNYHNVRTAIKSVWQFFTQRQSFIWKGWCIKDEYGDKK